MESKYDIHEGDLGEIAGRDVGQISLNGTCATFDELPFAEDVGDWRLPDGSFAWYRNQHGAYWLVTSSDPTRQRCFVLRPLARSEETT